MPATKLPDDQTWNLVAFIHAMTGPASENNVPGDVARGKEIFWGAETRMLELPFDSGQGRAHGT